MEVMLAFGMRHTLLWAFQCEFGARFCSSGFLFVLTMFHPDSIVICGIYYVAWIYVLPRLQHYQIRPEILSLDGSAATHKLVKVPTEQLAIWDSSHDASGRQTADRSEKGEGSEILKV